MGHESMDNEERTRLRREPQNGNHDPVVIREIIDSALMCHLGITDKDGWPIVIPTIHARVDDQLYIHGSAASRTLRRVAEGVEVCCTVTHLDGIVLARSGFWSSMNYRSVMIFGSARLVTDSDELISALNAIVDHVAPGRSSEIRPSSRNELAATKVIALPITEASAKIRTGDPNDAEDDLDTNVWAGVIPMRLVASEPIASANLAPGVAVPQSVRRFLARQADQNTKRN